MADTQVDLFLDQLVDALVRDERNLMDFPFFSLEKRPRRTVFAYDDGRVSIKIEPSAKGMATIWDKDILIYLTSILTDKIDRGLPVEPTIRFAAHDFLKATKRSSSNRGYDLLLDALYRLRNTSILTNIKAGGEADKRNFGWIADWRVIERVGRRGVKRMVGVEVTLSRWMFDAIVKDRRVMTISQGYFDLSQGLERRLYELVSKNCVKGKPWMVPLSRLAERCGSVREARKFKADIKAIAAKGGVLDFNLVVEERDDGAWANFGPRLFVSASEQLADEIIPPAASRAEEPVTFMASAKAFERARKLAPGYDIQNIERQWQEWVRKNSLAIENPDAHFIAFVKTHVERNPL